MQDSMDMVSQNMIGRLNESIMGVAHSELHRDEIHAAVLSSDWKVIKKKRGLLN